MSKIKISIIEKDEDIIRQIESIAKKKSFDLLNIHNNIESFIHFFKINNKNSLNKNQPDLLLIGSHLSEKNILSFYSSLYNSFNEEAELHNNETVTLFPIIVLRKKESISEAINLLKAGISDYIVLSNDLNRNLTNSISENFAKYKKKQNKIELEQELKNRVISYGLIARESPALIFYWKNEKNWPVEFVSSNIKDILGYKEEEFLSGKITYRDIVHPDDLFLMEKEIAQAMAKNDHVQIIHKPYRVYTKSGQIKWIDDRTKIQRDSHGNIERHIGILIDITKIKESEFRVQESANDIRLISESTSDVLLILSIFGKIIFANSAFLSLGGYTEKEVSGKSLFHFIPKIILAKNLLMFKEIFLKKEIKGFRTYLLHKNGSHIFVEINARLEIRKGKKVAVGSIHDLTQWAKLEKKLFYQKDILENAIEALNHPFMIINVEDYSVSIANSKAGAKLGLKLSDEFDKTIDKKNYCHELLQKKKSPCDENCFLCPVKEVLRKKEAVIVEQEYLNKNASIRIVEVHAQPVFDVYGNIKQVIEFSFDVTKQRQAEQKLIENEKALAAAHKIAGIGSFRHNINNNSEIWSKELCQIFGIGEKERELSFKEVLAFISKEDLPIFRRAYRTVLSSSQSANIDIRVHHPEKGDIIVNDQFYAIRNDENKAVEVFGVVQDITERKHIEWKLREASVIAESANKAKTAFLANMSHELRTPLNSILGFAQLLEMNRTQSLNEKDLEFVSKILNSGEHLLEMINGILDLTRIDAGKEELLLESFNFNHLLSEVLTSIQSIARKKNITLISGKDISIDEIIISADRIKIKQILYNLFSNAIKFTSNGGEVGVKLNCIDSNLQIIIWDTGIGFSLQDKDLIFHPFERLGQMNTGGTGLGLTISKSLVELHNGSITVSSEENKGSEFCISLPNCIVNKNISIDKKPVKLKNVNKEDEIKYMSEKTILVVDDVEDNSNLIKELLNISGFKVDIASNGLEAVILEEENNYDLIIMDINMPKMSGVEALQKIRKDKEDKKIIALTAYAMKGDEEKYLAEGFNTYITKPINAQSILDVVNKFLA